MRRRTPIVRQDAAAVRQVRPFSTAAEVDWPQTASNRGDMATESTKTPFRAMTVLLERRLSAGPLFWTLQAGGWLAFGILMFGWALAYWPIGAALLNKVLLVVIGLSISLGFRVAYRRLRDRAWLPSQLGFAVLGMSFAAAPIWYEAHIAAFRLSCRAILWANPHSTLAGGCARPVLLPLLVPTETWFFYGFVMVTWSLLYFVVDGIREVKNARALAARADALAVEARLKTLQSQLEPHFLFNVLNAISTLVATGRASAATAMITEVGEFLRATLNARDTPEVTVGMEVDFISRYFKIQKCRFGERLRAVFDVDPTILSAFMPTLILQPIVENAIKHGILPKPLGGCVWVRAARRGSMLVLEVEDDGVGLRDDAKRRAGVGLTNTRRRLEELYGNAARLQIDDSRSGGAIVRIEIPLQLPEPVGGAP
jgi:two-component system LytT family sensor kinase